MNRKDIFHTIGMINDDLIVQAGNATGRVRHAGLSKVAAIAVAAMMLLGATAFAAVILLSGRGGHSYNIPTYYTVPSQQILTEDVGFGIKIMDRFTNGYCFKAGYIAENEDYGMDGSVVEQYKSLICTYTKDGEELSLHVDQALAGIQLQDAEKAGSYKGSDLLYYSYTNKLVPPDYKMTEQDKKDRQSGKFVFSWGSPEVKINEVQGLAWEQEGTNYELNGINTSITKEQLIQMAKEMIDLQGETK